MKKIKVLNLCSGIGGNRKLWNNCEVTAIENNPKIAKAYVELFPNDTMIVDDAYQYLLDHFNEFDIIWGSFPCQSHSKMVKFTRHNVIKYPDLRFYEVIIFLQNFYNGKWVIENVKPYYEPLIKPTAKIGRHLFWSNCSISEGFDAKNIENFINKGTVSDANELKQWLGLNYTGNIYYDGNHCPGQVLRNAVHPELGLHVFNQLINN